MEGYPYPVIVEADWSSINTKTLQNKVQVYFLSKRKSQGGDCVIGWSEQNCTVFFRSEETRDRVLSKRDHAVTIENQVVKLKVSKPSSDSESHTETTQKSSETGSDVAAGFLQPAVQTTCSVRVDNVPADAVTNNQLLELYFEKWGGAVTKISTNPDQKTVIITFQSQDAVQRILDKTDHSICNVPVTIQPYLGDDETHNKILEALGDIPLSGAVVIEKVPDHFTREFLVLLVDGICSTTEDTYFLEFIPESSTAVVTFNDAKATEKFLLESQTKKRFQGQGLIARALEISKSVKVENLPAHCSEEYLELYFEKWGGAVDKIETLTDEQAAIITFQDQEAFKTITEKKLCINNKPINVYPYYPSLGFALYRKDRPACTLPKPFTDKIHPAIREFLHKTGQLSSVCNRMSSHFCQVNMDKDEVQFSPLPALLRQNGITKKHIDSWKQDTTDAFKNILSSFGVFKYTVIPSVWSAVEKDIRSVVKDKAVLMMDALTGCLTLAGMAKDIDMLKPTLENILKEATSQMEREKNKTSESITMSPAIYFLFQQEGLQKTASAKYPQLELGYKIDANQLSLTGLPGEVIDVKNLILERQLIRKEKIPKVDLYLLEFLTSVDSEEMSRDLFTSKGVSAVYRLENEKIILTASTEKALNEAEERLETMLTVQRLSVEDLSVLEKPEWQDLTNQLYETYNLSRKKTVLIKSSEGSDTVVVCGFKEPVTEVSKSLEEFINSHCAETETGSDSAAAAVLLLPDETLGRIESKAVVLEKMPENFTREVLMIFINTLCGLSDNEYLLEFVPESNTAVVTFNDLSAAEMFLKKCRNENKYQEHALTARALEISQSVKVENLPAQCPKDFLELYFEKWGGAVERIDTIPDEQAAIVTFHDQEAVKNILKKEHAIVNTPVDTYQYYPSLGSALYGKDRPMWTLPKPFTEKIHPAVREFLHKTGQVSSICNQMSSHFCQVNMDTDEVLFSPLPALLRQKGITKKKNIFSWKQDTTDAFKNILSSFGVFEYTVIPSVWTAVEQEIRSIVKDKAVLMMDASTESLALAGMAKDIAILKPMFENFLKNASLQLEKDTKGKLTCDEARYFKSCAVVKFIQEKKSDVWQTFLKSEKMKIHFSPKMALIQVSGESIQVKQALDFFELIAESLHTDNMTIRKAGAKKYFEKQGSMLLMMIREQRFVVVLEDASMEEEEDSYNEESYDGGTVEDSGQLSCQVQTPGGIVIQVLKADICHFKVDAVVSTANEDLKHIGGLALALLNAAGPSLQQNSDQYVAKHGRLQPGEAITTDAGRLPCKYVVHAVGPRYYSNDKVTSVKKLKQAVRESLNQAVLNRCSSIAVPAISSGIFGFPLELCAETIAQELYAYVENQNPQGGINTLKKIHLVDNNPKTVNAMAQAVKKEFIDFNPRMTFPQETGHGHHGHHGQNYHGNRGQGNLERNSGWEHQGTGARGNDRQRSGAKHSEHFETQRWSKPRFRTPPEDMSTSGSRFLEAQSTKEGLKIILQKGNIQDAHSDVIVNTVSQELDLSSGAVSKALLSAAGPQLQAEARSHLRALGTRLNPGDIVVTKGYNLNCQKVFHTACPFWSGGQTSEEKTLRGIIQNCLRRAENQKMASISFPAIGTGNLGFPREPVSRTLLSEIHAFSAGVSPQYLNEVTVIVHPSDRETVQCFVKSFRGEWRGPVMKGEHAVQQSPAKKTPPVRTAQSAGFFGTVSTPSLGVHKMRIGHLTLEVSSGDITKERCDVIINSSNQSFSLKAGVSKAILDAAGSAVEMECAQIVASQSQQAEMIMTSGGQLPCRNIIHILGRNKPEDIKSVVYFVLKFCEEQNFSSVAFPALGTGQGGAPPSAVADAMTDAVIDFVKKKKGTNMQSVKFLIFQTSMVSDFHQSMLKRQKESVEEEGGVANWFRDRVIDLTNFVTGRGYAGAPSNEEFVFVGEEFEPVVFQLCGESEEDLNEARKLITSLIVKEHMSSKIQDSAINYFSQEEADVLSKLQRELTVSIQLSKSGPEPAFTVEGLTRDVVKAESQIRDMIRKAEKNVTRQREAFKLSSQVEWQYQDRRRNLVPFDILMNYDLEQAFIFKQPRVTINIDNEPYEAQVGFGIATGRNGQIELKRIDLKQQSVSLPSHWDDMKGKLVLEVKLHPGNKEYSEVEKEFRKTGLASNILQIERIQNETLWNNYMNQKSYLEEKNKHKNNEKLLFHGTSSQNIKKINLRGFDRGYAGTSVGAMYGNGVYFAVDPRYSARGYAKPDQNGHKRMYYARVLVGDSTVGKPQLLAPPVKSSTGPELYDSVTDPHQTMFVIFHDVQAYPEYLITFQ